MKPIKNVVMRLSVVTALLSVGFAARNAEAVPTGLCSWSESQTYQCDGDNFCVTHWYTPSSSNGPSCGTKMAEMTCSWNEDCANPDHIPPGGGSGGGDPYGDPGGLEAPPAQ